MSAPLNPGAFPTAAGAPSYSGDYSSVVLETQFRVKYYLSTVFGELANTNYQGAVSNYGDTVRIPIAPDIAVHEYVDLQPLDTQLPGSDSIDLRVDRGLYFNALVPDVQAMQSQLDFVAAWSSDASMRVAIRTDRELLNEIPPDAHIHNQGANAGAISQGVNLGTTGSALQVSPVTALDCLYRGILCFDEQDVPPGNRSAVAPSWFIHYLKRSELRDASLTGDAQSTVRNGKVGVIDTIGNIYQSNNLQPIADGGNSAHFVLLFHTDAVTFVGTMTNLQRFVSPDTFGEVLRGLHVYGFKTIKPEGLVSLYVRNVPAATTLE